MEIGGHLTYFSLSLKGIKVVEIGGHLTYFSLSLKGIKVVRLPHRGYIFR